LVRVLVVETAGNLWGSERALLDLIRVLPKASVAVCCPPGMPLNAELEKLGILILPYFVYELHRKSKWRRLQAAVGVFRACMDFRPDVIYLNQSGSYRVVLPAATVLDLPVVAHVRIFEDAAYLAKQRPSQRRLRGVIAISSAVAAEIGRFPQLERIPIHTMYDAYIPSAASFSGSERMQNRIACVGRLVPIKGQDVLVSALRTMNGSNGRVECLFAGAGDEAFVQQLKQTAHGGDSIRWLGFVQDVTLLLRTCSVLVCPSHSEPLGRVIFEAWDAGAVPIAFAGSGGAAEIIAAAQGGILYDEQTPQSLAMALKTALYLDGEQRTKLIDNGRTWMAEHCDSQKYGESISNIWASVVVRGAA